MSEGPKIWAAYATYPSPKRTRKSPPARPQTDAIRLTKKLWALNRKLKGLCVSCPKPSGEKTRCPDCMRKFSKARALKLKLDDRCSRCGRKAGRKNGSTCNTCLDYQRDWRRKKYGVLPENYRKKTAR